MYCIISIRFVEQSVPPKEHSLIRIYSVSPQFCCVHKIYEMNISVAGEAPLTKYNLGVINKTAVCTLHTRLMADWEGGRLMKCNALDHLIGAQPRPAPATRDKDDRPRLLCCVWSCWAGVCLQQCKCVSEELLQHL